MGTDVKVTGEGTKIYLKGVAPLDWGTGEMCEFAASLTRMLACVGEDVPYHTVMGVTGVAFRFSFGPELWNPGFYGFSGVASDVGDLIRRAFSAVGHEYGWRPTCNRADDLKRITESIDRGVAVMLRGHVVDASDWALVTGYAEDGNTLIGSSPYGGKDRFNGFDLMPDWHANTRETIVLGAKCPRPAPEEIHTDALKLAVRLMRTSADAEPYTGLNAYDMLISALRDEDYPEVAEREARAVYSGK